MSFYAICPVDKEAYKLEGNDLLDKLVCPNCGVSEFSEHKMVDADSWDAAKKINATRVLEVPSSLPELSEREQSIMDKYTHTVVSDYNTDITVWLQVQHQNFALRVEPESMEHAEWHRRMLAIALARMIDNDV